MLPIVNALQKTYEITKTKQKIKNLKFGFVYKSYIYGISQGSLHPRMNPKGM